MEAWRIVVKNGVLQSVDPGLPAVFLRSHPVGAYTTTRTSDGASNLLLWERHLARLAQSVSLLAVQVPELYPGVGDSGSSNWRSRLRDAAHSSTLVGLAKALELRDSGEIAVTILACGSEERCLESQVLVHFSPYTPHLPAPPPARLAVMGPARHVPLAKFSAWARTRQVLERCKPQHATEVLLSDDGDTLLEGALTNFFVVATTQQNKMKSDWQGMEVQTACLEEGVLPGVIRQIIIQICQDEGIPLREVAPSWSNRQTWREAFITSSLRLVQGVQSVVRPDPWSASQAADRWKGSSWDIHDLPQTDGRVTRRLRELVQAYSNREGLSIANLRNPLNGGGPFPPSCI